MAGGVRSQGGGILGLRRLLAEHQEAIEYDLIGLGLRLDWLGTEALSWRDLLVITHKSPQGSALYAGVHGERSEWGLSEFLLAHMIDLLAEANWQRTGRPGGHPKPFPRPGLEPEGTTYGSDPIPLDEMAEWLGWPKPSMN